MNTIRLLSTVFFFLISVFPSWSTSIHDNMLTNTYCAAEGSVGTGGDFINKVTLNTINNSSPQTRYGNFTAISTDLIAGESYPIEVQVNYAFDLDSVYVWIDYDIDGVFEEHELTIMSQLSLGENAKSKGIVEIPADAAGETRMRVRVIYQNTNTADPCGSYFGEVEDYIINLCSDSNNDGECDCPADMPDCNLIATSNVSDAFISLNWNLDGTSCISSNTDVFIRLMRIEQDGSEQSILLRDIDLGDIYTQGSYEDSFVDKVAPNKNLDYRLEVRLKDLGALLCSFKASGSTLPFQAPSDFQASDGGTGEKVVLNWKHESDLDIAYRIFRTNGENTELIGEVKGTTEIENLSYEDAYSNSNTGLLSGQTYTYCIEPYFAPTVEIFEQVCEEGRIFDIAFQASDDVFENKINLSWNTLPEEAEELEIFENNRLIATLPASSTQFDVLNPLAGKPHTYRLEVKSEESVLMSATDLGSIPPNGLISGRITTLNQGFPVPQVQVSLNAVVNNEPLTLNTTSDELGYYEFDALFYEESSDFTISVSKDGQTFQEAALDVTLAKNRNKNTQLDFKQLEQFPEKELNADNPEIEIDAVVSEQLRGEDKLKFEVSYFANQFPLFLDITRDGERVELMKVDPSTSLEWIDATGVPNQQYQYQFKFFTTKEDSIISIISGSRAQFPDVAPPADLKDNVLTNIGFAELNWMHTSTNFDGFVLSRGEETIGDFSPNELNFTDKTAFPGLTSYALQAYRIVDGETYFSQKRTIALNYPELPIPIAPAFPQGAPNAILIRWSLPSQFNNFDYTGFKIYRDGKAISTVYKNASREFLDFNWIPNTTHQYQVRTFRQLLGEEILSDPYEITTNPRTLTMPANFTVSDGDGGFPFQLLLNWTFSNSAFASIDGFVVLHDGNEILRTGLEFNVSGFDILFSHTINALHQLPETYELKAYKTIDGVDYFSEAVTDTGFAFKEPSLLDPIIDFTASTDKKEQINLTWSYPDFIKAEFVIHRDFGGGVLEPIAVIDSTFYKSEPNQSNPTIRTYSFNHTGLGELAGEQKYRIFARIGDFTSPSSFTKGKVASGKRISGRVYHKDSNKPVLNASLTLETEYAVGTRLPNGSIRVKPIKYSKKIQVDSSGYYLFENVPNIKAEDVLDNATASMNISVQAPLPFGTFIEPTKTLRTEEELEQSVDFINTFEVPVIETDEIAQVSSIHTIGLNCDLASVITWDTDHDNYDGFEIMRGVNVIGEVEKGEALKFIDRNNLNTGILQVYQVRAFLETPTGRIFSETKSTALILPEFPTIENLYASKVPTGNSVFLNWSHTCDSHTGYFIERNGERIDTVYTGNALVYQDITGVPGENYTYTVTPYLIKDNLIYKAAPKSTLVQYPAINQVENLSFRRDFLRNVPARYINGVPEFFETPYFLNSVTLSWEYDGRICQGFAIFRDEELLAIKDCSIFNVSLYGDETGIPEKNYQYRVAVILERQGGKYFSEPLAIEVEYPKLSPPSSLRSSNSGGTVKLEFTYELAKGAEEFRIYRGLTKETLEPIGIVNEENKEGAFYIYTDNTGLLGTDYVYGIQALSDKSDKVSDISTLEVAYPTLPAPTKLTASDNASYNTIFLEWEYDQNIGTDQFIIKRSLDAEVSFSEIARVEAGDRKYEDIFSTSLGVDRISYRVIAVKQIANRVFKSSPSNIASASVSIASIDTSFIFDKHSRIGAIAMNDEWAVVGESENNLTLDGELHFFNFNGVSWDSVYTITGHRRLGLKVALDGNRIITRGNNSGEINIHEYDENSSTWSVKEVIKNVSTSSFAIRRNLIAVRRGNAIAIHKFDRGEFRETQIIPLGVNPSSDYTISLALSDDYLVVGIPSIKLESRTDDRGLVKIYKRNGNNWEFSEELTVNDLNLEGVSDSAFGSIISFSDNHLAIKLSKGIITYKLEESKWIFDTFIPTDVNSSSFSISEEHLVINGGNDRAELFERDRDDQSWVLNRTILAPDFAIGYATTVSHNDRFIVANVVTNEYRGIIFQPIHKGLYQTSATDIADNTPTKTTVSWEYDSGNQEASEIIKGFNVYRDSEKINEGLIKPDERSFNDSEGIAGKQHVYEVEMIWKDDLPGPRLADVGSRAGVGRIEGKVITNTPSQSGVASVEIIATAMIDGEYYSYRDISTADGSFNLTRLYIGTEKEETVYTIDAKFKDHIFKYEPNVKLRLDKTTGNKVILDETAFIIVGEVKREHFTCGLDSIGIKAITTLTDGTEIVEETTTNAEGRYGLTVDPTRAGLAAIEIVIDSTRIVGEKEQKTFKYLFEADAPTRITDFENLKRNTIINFTDVFSYPIELFVKDACLDNISSDQFLIRASSDDGCYDRVFTTRKDIVGKITADLPPIDLTLRVEEVKNDDQAVSTTSLVAVDYFRFRPVKMDLLSQHLDSLLTRNSIIRANETTFTFHKPPSIAITKGRTFKCDNPEFSAISEQGKDEKWTISVSETHNGNSCSVTEGYLKITNPGAKDSRPQIIAFDEKDGRFPDYVFEADKPNIIDPYEWAVSIEYFSPNDNLLGQLEQNLFIEGLAAIPGNGALVGADTTGGGLVQLPLFVLRKPPGDQSYSSIATGTTITKSLSINENTEIAAGLITEAEGRIAGVGTFGSAELLFGGNVGDGQSWEYSLTTTETYSTEGVGADLIVGMGVAQQYGLQQQVKLKEGDCETIRLEQILGFSPVKVSTQWAYSVPEIEEIIRQLDVRIERIRTGLDQINDENGKPLSIEEAAAQFEVIRENWNQVLIYHGRNTLPHYVICTQGAVKGIPDEINEAISDWQCEFCPKVAPDYNCDTKIFSDFNADVAWTQELVDLYNKAYAAINGLLEAPFEIGTLGTWRLTKDRLKEDNAYINAQFDAISGLPQAQYFTSGQEGGTRSFSAATSSTRSYSNSFFINSELTAGLAWGTDVESGVSAFGVSLTAKTLLLDLKVGLKATVNYDITEDRELSKEETVEQTYFIGDDDFGDTYTVAVIQGTAQNHTPYFWTLGGSSSCPVEEGTLPRDRLDINLYSIESQSALGKIQTLFDVEGEEAFFTLQLANTNVEEDRLMEIFLVPASNRNAASVSLAGTQLGSEIVAIPAGGSVILDLILNRGRKSFNHEHIVIGARPACSDGEPDDSEVKYIDISAFFSSSCSKVSLSRPETGWFINRRDIAQAGTTEQLQIDIVDFELDNPNLDNIRLQYRRLHSDNDWNEIIGSTKTVQELKAFVAEFGRRPVPFIWDITDDTNIVDGIYEIRAVALCEDLETESYSNYVQGRIDRNSIVLFSTAPADGIWSRGDAIFAQFNKPLFEEKLNQEEFIANNFSLHRKSNGAVIPALFYTEANKVFVNPSIDITTLSGETLVVTLKNLQDESGNSYAVRNLDGVITNDEVKWEFDVSIDELLPQAKQVTVEVYQGNQKSLQTAIMNTIGLPVIANLNSNSVQWLSHPNELEIPLDGQDLLLNFDATALKPGIYTETININAVEEEVETTIEVKLIVHAKPENWVVEKYQFTRKMELVTNYRFSGTFSISTDSLDIISVWIEGEMRGSAKIKEVGGYHIAYLTIYGNESDLNRPMTFKVWNAKEGKSYEAVFPFELVYREGLTLGSTHAAKILTIDKVVVSETDQSLMVSTIRNEINEASSTIQVFPNPTKGILNIRATENNADKVHLQLYNAVGTLVIEKRLAPNGISYQESLNISQLPNGIYLLKIDNGSSVMTQKVIKD